jgi:small subunit ribosomal protein S8
MNAFYNAILEINKGIFGLKSNVFVFSSKSVRSLLDLLLKCGFIQNFVVLVDDKKINVLLKYIEHKSVLMKLVIISKPGRRIYVTKQELELGYGFGNIYIISGPRGLFMYQYGQKVESGGEIMLKVLK